MFNFAGSDRLLLNVGQMLAKCWPNVSQMLAKCGFIFLTIFDKFDSNYSQAALALKLYPQPQGMVETVMTSRSNVPSDPRMESDISGMLGQG